MPDFADKITDDLRNNNIASFYDQGGSIGKDIEDKMKAVHHLVLL